ncbi:MAG: hypothetical protein ACLFWL_00670 [Candidatus Brocadiia bacterium]
MQVWVHDYVQITLYTKEPRYGGVPIDNIQTYTATVPRFPDEKGHGLLSCPGSEFRRRHWSNGHRFSFDYWPAGFGTWYWAGGDARRHSRIGKAGRDSNGAHKAFLLDNLFRYKIPDHRAFMYDYATCHQPADPRGMNVVEGGGSCEWVTEYVEGTNSRAVPLGYYTQTTYYEWDTWRAFSYVDPGGNRHSPRAPNPGEETSLIIAQTSFERQWTCGTERFCFSLFAERIALPPANITGFVGSFDSANSQIHAGAKSFAALSWRIWRLAGSGIRAKSILPS